MYVQEHKKLLRRQMETKRSALAAEERKMKSAAICQTAIQSFLQPFFVDQHPDRMHSANDPVLFTYIPTKAEVDVTPILEWCWLNQVAIAAPRVVPAGRQLTLHVIKSFDDLQEGAYGILEPKVSVPKLERMDAVQMMLVPGLAFDTRMGRLGYGGGYYDRFMRRCLVQTGKEPFKLALSYDVQIVPSVPMAPHDLMVDAVVTETSVYRNGH
jgi:5-formyltetrahydrofolate cyclo-ligase